MLQKIRDVPLKTCTQFPHTNVSAVGISLNALVPWRGTTLISKLVLWRLHLRHSIYVKGGFLPYAVHHIRREVQLVDGASSYEMNFVCLIQKK
jgi:hypothetical protein